MLASLTLPTLLVGQPEIPLNRRENAKDCVASTDMFRVLLEDPILVSMLYLLAVKFD